MTRAGLSIAITGVISLALAATAWAEPEVKGSTPEAAPEVKSVALDEARAKCDARVDALKGKTGLKVLVIRVEGEIDIRQAAYVGRAVRQAHSFKPDLVLLELDTPGGDMGYMEEIGNAIRSLEPTPTVAYVDNEAFSAGVYLAISCDRIAMKTSSVIGASTPWMQNPSTGMPVELTEDVKKKHYSAAKAIFRAVAQEKGYPPGLTEGMIDPDVTVQEVTVDGKKMILTQDEADNLRTEMKRTSKGSFEEQQAEMDRRLVTLSTVVEKGKGPISLTTPEAQRYGLAEMVVGSRDELLKNLGIETPQVQIVEHSWSETTFGWFAGPMVSGILLTIGLIALYIEFNSPGLILPAVVGVTCIVLVLFSQYFVGLADYTDIIIFLIGAALLAAELFLLPGHGVMGIMGLILMIGALFLSRQPFVKPDFNKPWQVELFYTNFIVIGASLVGFLIAALTLARYLPGLPYFNRLVLQATGPAPLEELVGSAGMATPEIGPGTAGVSMSQLRPSGRARFGDKILDVVTRGEFIEPGQPIEVLEVKGYHIVVRAAGRSIEETKA